MFRSLTLENKKSTLFWHFEASFLYFEASQLGFLMPRSSRDLRSATLGTRNLLFNHFQCTLPSNQTLLNHPRISRNSAEAINHPINCQLASVPPTPVPPMLRKNCCCRSTRDKFSHPTTKKHRNIFKHHKKAIFILIWK